MTGRFIRGIKSSKDCRFEYAGYFAQKEMENVPGYLGTPDDVKDYILTNKLEISDFPWLMAHYDQESSNMKERLFIIFSSYTDLTIQHAASMCGELRARVFESNEFERADKVRMLDLTADKMSKDEVIKTLRIVKADKIADNLEDINTKVDNNSTNTEILNMLANRRVIQPPAVALDRRHFKKVRFYR